MDEYEALAKCDPTSRVDCLCYIPSLAITLWIGLSFNLKGPRCYINELYVPALDLLETSNATTSINPCLFFDLSLENILSDHSIRYGDVNLTFFYGQNRSFPAIANYIVPGFYQGKGKTAHRRDVVETRGVPWDNALRTVSNGSKAVFRVGLAARPRFRFWFWYSKKKGLKLEANVEVDGSGMKVLKDDIPLKSGASKHTVGFFVIFLNLLISLSLF